MPDRIILTVERGKNGMKRKIDFYRDFLRSMNGLSGITHARVVGALNRVRSLIAQAREGYTLMNWAKYCRKASDVWKSRLK